MSTSLAALTNLAALYRQIEPRRMGSHPGFTFDEAHMAEVADLATGVHLRPGLLDEARDALSADPELARLGDTDSPHGFMVLGPSGGGRLRLEDVPSELLGGALAQRYLFRLEEDDETLARLLIEGLQELKRALRGEPVRYYEVQGFTGVTLQPGSEIHTPWGVLRPAPAATSSHHNYRVPPTTVLRVSEKLAEVYIDDSDAPVRPAGDELEVHLARRAQVLVPLACALGVGPEATAAPIGTWGTGLLPFQMAHGFSGAVRGPYPFRGVDLTAHRTSIEDWARRLDETHSPRVDVAANRTVTALALRLDPADSLIDAVMAWENLVGTTAETTFRVTGSLARLLEPDASRRSAFRKELAEVYSVRSRVVHGNTVDPADVQSAAQTAMSVAIRALQACYRRGNEWLDLKSEERAERLLVID